MSDQNIQDITKNEHFAKDRDSLLGGGSFSQVYVGSFTRSDGQTSSVSIFCRSYPVCLTDGIDLQVAVKRLMHTPANSTNAEERLRRELITWKHVSTDENFADILDVYRTPDDPSRLVSPFFRYNNFLRYTSQHPSGRLALVSVISTSPAAPTDWIVSRLEI